jgi:hypothetical protein
MLATGLGERVTSDRGSGYQRCGAPNHTYEIFVVARQLDDVPSAIALSAVPSPETGHSIVAP